MLYLAKMRHSGTQTNICFFVEFLYFLFYAVAEFQSANVIEDS